MHKSILPFTVALCATAAALVGCEWGGVGSDEAWNDAYAWANFSGTYKLVTGISSGGSSESGSSENNSGENGSGQNNSGQNNSGQNNSGENGSGGGSNSSSKTEIVETQVSVSNNKLVYDKNKSTYLTGYPNLVPGTVSVSLGMGFKDDGNGNLVYNGAGSTAGTVVYETGTITLLLESSDATHYHGKTFSVTAKQTVQKAQSTTTKKLGFAKKVTTTNNGDGTITTTTTTTTTSSTGESSTTKTRVKSSYITWLNVTQKGNLLTIKDNYGTTYTGKITGASCPRADEGGYIQAAHIRFPFEATCTADSRITLSGSLSGDWSGGSSETSGTLANRTIDATYHSGKGAAQFQAVSGTVTVSPQQVAPYAGTTAIPPYVN